MAHSDTIKYEIKIKGQAPPKNRQVASDFVTQGVSAASQT